MHAPLVSVICLCYNHQRFVQQALESVLNQTYKNIQIIVVDDASTDNSAVLIQKIIKGNSAIQYLSLQQNQGICKAFNQGLALASGNYIIDFATDDIMEPEKVEHQVNFFSSLDNRYGVVFSDATYIDADGKFIRDHYEYLFRKRLLAEIPQGEIYTNILLTYFISSPSMMVKKEVFNKIGGYDEMLSYEDFDFWIRSSRHFKYGYLNEKLIKVRRTVNSMSTGWYVPGDPQLYSTYLVCKKAQQLNRTERERSALIQRVRYELRQSIFSENKSEAKLFHELLVDLNGQRLIDNFTFLLSQLNLPLSLVRNWYHKMRY